MKGIPACRCVCISMYKQMYTYICISYNIWTWIGNSHIIHITLSCQRDFFYTSRCRFTFSCWSKPLTQNTEWSASSHMHLTLPVWAICCGATQTPSAQSLRDSLWKQTHTQTHFLLRPRCLKNDETQDTDIYIYIKINKTGIQSTNWKQNNPKKTPLKRMVTVHEWVDRAVHGGIVFTLGPGCLPRRRRGRQTRWPEADSQAAARPPLAPPPNWTSSAAGRPDRCLQTLRLTCGTQADRGWAAVTVLPQSRCWQTLTCHCWLMSTLALWARPLCSSCLSSSVWLCHCLISHWVLLSSLDRTI